VFILLIGTKRLPKRAANSEPPRFLLQCISLRKRRYQWRSSVWSIYSTPPTESGYLPAHDGTARAFSEVRVCISYMSRRLTPSQTGWILHGSSLCSYPAFFVEPLSAIFKNATAKLSNSEAATLQRFAPGDRSRHHSHISHGRHKSESPAWKRSPEGLGGNLFPATRVPIRLDADQ
jgi:hypothetical protein